MLITRKLVAGAALAVLAATVAIGIGDTPEADAHVVGWETRSLYAHNGDSHSDFYHLGCEMGQNGWKGYTAILWGRTADLNPSDPYPLSRYGAFPVNGSANLSLATMASRTHQLGKGYDDCAPAGYWLRIGLGVSNYEWNPCEGEPVNYRAQTWAHGNALADAVNLMNSWAAGEGLTQISYRGAWDVEPCWSPFSRANSWSHGYFAGTARSMIHMASADGCPPYGSCDNGWSQYAVWHLAEGETSTHRNALPFPQNYATGGANADQWFELSEYGYHSWGTKINFTGFTSQHAACQEVGGCNGTDNTPHFARRQLHELIQAHSHTQDGSHPYTTNLTYIGEHLHSSPSH